MKVIISAAGTAGHINPAIAIANIIKSKEKDSEIIFIGTERGLEKELVPRAGYKLKTIDAYGLSKKISIDNLKKMYKTFRGIGQAKKIIKEFKPDIVIGVGGYVTFPVIMAAHKLKIKTFLHEQNAIPGKSNKFLIKYADKIGISFKESSKYFPKDKWILTGNPCSENALNIKTTSRTKYGLTYDKKSILIVQGSLGSEVINNKMLDFLKSIDDKNYEVLYVTGKNYYDSFSKNKFSKNVKIVPFVENLSSLLKDIDLIITRAGASTIAEITAIGLPAILIPSPYVANNHQYYNALSLKNSNASTLIEQKDLNKDILIKTIDEILDNKDLYNTYHNNLLKLSISNSSTIIYESIKKLINEEK